MSFDEQKEGGPEVFHTGVDDDQVTSGRKAPTSARLWKSVHIGNKHHETV
jgi:hypothetical protein